MPPSYIHITSAHFWVHQYTSSSHLTPFPTPLSTVSSLPFILTSICFSMVMTRGLQMCIFVVYFVRQQLTPSKLCVKCDVIFQSTAPIPRSFDQSRTASRVQPADWMPADGSAAKAVWTPTVPLSHIKVFSARAEICFMCVIVGNEQNTVYVGKAVKRQFINEIVTSGASLAWHGQRHS